MTKDRFAAVAASVMAMIVALALSNAAMADDAVPSMATSGIIKVKSAYPLDETVARLKKDVAGKGIKFFDEIDQSRWLRTRASRCGRPRFSFSAIRRWERCSLPPIRWRDSTGRSACSCCRTRTATCGLRTRISRTSPVGTTSRVPIWRHFGKHQV